MTSSHFPFDQAHVCFALFTSYIFFAFQLQKMSFYLPFVCKKNIYIIIFSLFSYFCYYPYSIRLQLRVITNINFFRFHTYHTDIHTYVHTVHDFLYFCTFKYMFIYTLAYILTYSCFFSWSPSFCSLFCSIRIESVAHLGINCAATRRLPTSSQSVRISLCGLFVAYLLFVVGVVDAARLLCFSTANY